MLALMAAGGIAFIVAVLGTPFLMRWLKGREIGQQIRSDGPGHHIAKAGTPTMGGLVIIAAVVLGFLAAHVGTSVHLSRPGFLVLFAIASFGLLGFIDDWLKIRNRRSLGLNKRAKFLGQLIASAIFAILAAEWAGASTSLSFTRLDLPGWHFGVVVWVLLAILIMVGSSNAVNLTDGLDGLASGSATLCFAVLAIAGYWQFRHLDIYQVKDALDLALADIALAGACLGFLWWNAPPAKIYMGDTGSLAIGSGLAALCILQNLELLLPIIGGLFVIETLSVIVQVASFRLIGRRVFKMAPIHHHFELLGWPESTVIIRFWILGGQFAALGLGIFYGDFLSVAKVV
ncbi:MAG: phospho-N-acetylmuramoyl-pentapeptide-transferase [Actinomycetes bacterium]